MKVKSLSLQKTFAFGGDLTPVALILPNDTTFEEWTEIGKRLQKAEQGLMWWIGDWWAFGEHHYGDRVKEFSGEDDEGYKFQTLANAGSVSRKIETSRRREVLSWTHHSEVAGLEPDEQDALLADAIENKWSTRDIRRAARRVQANRKQRELSQFPTGKYRILYADPPWEYGNEQPAYHTEQANHYPLMTLEELCGLPVLDISEDDAVLFLWTTSPMIPEAIELATAWGFEYKTSFIWDKIKHNMGHYNSVRHELLFVCVRGSCPPDEQKLFDSVVSVERTGHSEKPEIFRHIIDTIYPLGKRIELFSRVEVAGWDSFHNERTELQRLPG